MGSARASRAVFRALAEHKSVSSHRDRLGRWQRPPTAGPERGDSRYLDVRICPARAPVRTREARVVPKQNPRRDGGDDRLTAIGLTPLSAIPRERSLHDFPLVARRAVHDRAGRPIFVVESSARLFELLDERIELLVQRLVEIHKETLQLCRGE